MQDFGIDYPALNYKNYIESIYKLCKDNKFSMILKGSVAKGTATRFSDIDLIILGDIAGEKVDELITFYDNPIMINFTENPKGILILVYQDNISVDLDLRETISQEELKDSIVLLKYSDNFIVTDETIIRKEIVSSFTTTRPDWYKTLRLVHRGVIKYLSNKTDNAYDLLSEIKEKLNELEINNLNFNNNFEDDVQCIFNELYKKYKFDSQIQVLFNNLFREF